MARTTNKPLVSLLFAVAILALLFGVWSQANKSKHSNINTTPAQLESGTVFNQPRAISTFKLTDDQDQTFTNANLRHHWTLVFFGFTNCPELCPTTLSALNKSYKAISQLKNIPKPQVLLVSVDPERDTPAKLKTYLNSFNSAFLGATGNPAEIKRMTQEFGVLYMKVAAKNEGISENANYDIDHSGAVMLINPQGQLVAIFTSPQNTQAFVKDYQIILKRFNQSSA